ncbi:superinfection immunity protein [Streptomyces sp. NPDC041068]|uniref:superinfection immunity protein n=1 Tax=Streptomyces sp. NPDC041068 TaxID=3155130 RepID=UPI0033D58E2A
MFSDIGVLGAVVLTVLVTAVYLLPSLIAFNRGAENRWLVLVVNLVFGASVIGWCVALHMATRKPKVPAHQPA